jgi:hypothetical protein
MSKTLIAVSDSTNPVISEYVQNQLEAIKNLYPELTIEHVNETNEIMDRYARYPNRLPAFFVLKNGARMSSLQAKVTTEQLIDWFKSTSG